MITLEEQRELGLMRKRVYAEVFNQAVEDLTSCDLTIKLPAIYWFQSSSRDPLSFLFLCDIFNFVPELVLSALSISEVPGQVNDATLKKAREFLERWHHTEKVENATEATLGVEYGA